MVFCKCCTFYKLPALTQMKIDICVIPLRSRTFNFSVILILLTQNLSTGGPLTADGPQILISTILYTHFKIVLKRDSSAVSNIFISF